MAFDSHFEIFEATDGQQALGALDTCDPDVIVLDLRMPRMDGLDFIRRLGRTRVRGAIVVCSGALNDGERPVIPGVRLAPKSADLRDLWSALLSAVPQLSATIVAGRQNAAPVEDSFWRD
jgi:CheY-like chemotaxis protein